VIRVVVLLKLRRHHPVPCQATRLRQTRRESRNVVLLRLRRSILVVCDRLIVLDLDLHTRLGDEFGKVDGVEDLLDVREVGGTLEAVVEGVKVGGGDNELEVSGLCIVR
jgi:hypothetical protein